MYLRNIFHSKPTQVVGTAVSLLFGLYNLYLLGRCDEIEELVDISEQAKEATPKHPYHVLPFKVYKKKGFGRELKHLRIEEVSDLYEPWKELENDK